MSLPYKSSIFDQVAAVQAAQKPDASKTIQGGTPLLSLKNDAKPMLKNSSSFGTQKNESSSESNQDSNSDHAGVKSLMTYRNEVADPIDDPSYEYAQSQFAIHNILNNVMAAHGVQSNYGAEYAQYMKAREDQYGKVNTTNREQKPEFNVSAPSVSSATSDSTSLSSSTQKNGSSGYINNPAYDGVSSLAKQTASRYGMTVMPLGDAAGSFATKFDMRQSSDYESINDAIKALPLTSLKGKISIGYSGDPGNTKGISIEVKGPGAGKAYSKTEMEDYQMIMDAVSKFK